MLALIMSCGNYSFHTGSAIYHKFGYFHQSLMDEKVNLMFNVIHQIYICYTITSHLMIVYSVIVPIY